MIVLWVFPRLLNAKKLLFRASMYPFIIKAISFVWSITIAKCRKLQQIEATVRKKTALHNNNIVIVTYFVQNWRRPQVYWEHQTNHYSWQHCCEHFLYLIWQAPLGNLANYCRKGNAEVWSVELGISMNPQNSPQQLYFCLVALGFYVWNEKLEVSYLVI